MGFCDGWKASHSDLAYMCAKNSPSLTSAFNQAPGPLCPIATGWGANQMHTTTGLGQDLFPPHTLPPGPIQLPQVEAPPWRSSSPVEPFS